jgi:hypothetical protein
MIKKVVDNLPQEKRKGYLFNPKAMLSMKLMVETVLEADGITKEMIQAQEERMKLIQRLLSASEDTRKDIVTKEDEIIDGDFFSIFSTLMQSAISARDERAARQLNEVQKAILEHSTMGREIKAEANEYEAAMKALQKLGREITREDLLGLVVKSPTDTRLRAYVRLARPGMDYQFFQMLSERIEHSQGDDRVRLVEIRQKLLDYTQRADEELATRVEVTRKNLEALLNVADDDLEATIQQNIEAIDEIFLQVLTQELESSRKISDLGRSAKLEQIAAIIEEAATPPAELDFIEELLEVADDAALQKLIAEQGEKITPELMEVLTGLVGQTQSALEQAQGKEKAEQEEVAKRIQTVYNAVLKFSMQRSFKGE